MHFSDTYDFNPQTRKKVPEGVNRNDFGKGVKHPDSHAITVGDLCFVALAWIFHRSVVDRRFSLPYWAEEQYFEFCNHWSAMPPFPQAESCEFQVGRTST